jgi:hypothetical protein
MKPRVLLTSALLVLAAASARAEGEKPINLSLFPPVQIFDENTSIAGLRLGVYSYNADVTGLDVGLVQRSSGHLKGLQWAVVGWAEGGFTGWQNSWINFAKGASTGVQTGFVNYVATAEGFQWGGVNYGESFSGLQLSFLNIADELDGLQVGILNVAKNKTKFRWLPIVNWNFE